MLLKSAKLLIYTPSNEHFGIVPLEAMLAGVPVLAANTGGPLETVVDGETGWHCPPDEVEKWTTVINKVLNKLSDEELANIGNAGKARVRAEFSDAKMAERFDEIIDAMVGARRREWIVTAAFWYSNISMVGIVAAKIFCERALPAITLFSAFFPVVIVAATYYYG